MFLDSPLLRTSLLPGTVLRANGQTDDCVTTFTYTTGSANPADPPAGLLATETDPLGHVTSYQYNARGLVTQITYAVGTADEAHVHVEYDAAWRIWAQVYELGRRTEYGYDSSNRVTTVTQPDPDGPSGPLSVPVTSYQYNDLGQLVSETDPVNRVTSYTYEDGRLTSVARPDHDGNGQLTVTTMAYTSAGLLASITDPLGRATGYGYDAQSRRTSVTLPDPDGAGEQSAPVTQYAYDALGRVISTSDAQNNVTSYVYSNHGRTVTVTEPDPDGAGALSAPVTVLQYDSAGNILSQTDALGRETSYGYDSLGRQTTITEPDPDGAGPLVASVTHYGYDKAGNLTSVTDSLNQVTEYVYDARNRRTQIIDGEEGVTQFAYDAVGNLLTLTDPVGNTTAWQYDGLNRVIAETNELDFTRTFRYDAAGRQTQRVDRLGRVIVYAYDPLDNLTTETWYANQSDADAQANPVNVIHYTHDAAGRLLSEWDTYSSSTYTYDALDRVLSETIANPDSPTVVLSTGYADSPLLPAEDGQGVKALRTTLSATIAGAADFLRTFEYDSRGQLTAITQTGQTGGNAVANLQIDLAYDSLGRFASITRYQDSHLVATSTWQYDAAYHLTALTHAQGATTLAGYTWTYDSAGRLTQMTSPDGTVVYSYDSTSQLTGADYSGAQDDEIFDWDANGNPSGTGYVIGPNNQLLSDGTYRYDYDAEGNRSARYVWTDADSDGVVDPGERSQITEYSWDHRNRLTSVTFKNAQEQVTKAVDYLYDTSNRRIAKEVDDNGDGQTDRGQCWIYDSESASTSSADTGATAGLKVSHVLFEFDLDGDITRRNLHGSVVDQILAEEDLASDPGNVEVLWPLADHLGTVRDLAILDPATDETSVANHITYSSFGEIVSQSSPAVAIRFSYTGREWDVDASLYYYRARWYDAQTSQFAGEDLACVTLDGANLRRYVGNAPLMQTDPAGLHGVPVTVWDIRNGRLVTIYVMPGAPLPAGYLPLLPNGMPDLNYLQRPRAPRATPVPPTSRPHRATRPSQPSNVELPAVPESHAGGIWYPIPVAGAAATIISKMEAETANEYYGEVAARLTALLKKLKEDGRLDEAVVKKIENRIAQISNMKQDAFSKVVNGVSYNRNTLTQRKGIEFDRLTRELASQYGYTFTRTWDEWWHNKPKHWAPTP